MLHLRHQVILLAGMIVIAGASGCAPAVSTQTKDVSPPLQKNIAKTSISELKKAPENWQNKQVLISGKYRGWEASCSDSGQRTRSDWVIQDDTGCIFVSGIMPGNLSPTQPKGQLLSVVGTLRLTSAGLPYLEGSEVKIMPTFHPR